MLLRRLWTKTEPTWLCKRAQDRMPTRKTICLGHRPISKVCPYKIITGSIRVEWVIKTRKKLVVSSCGSKDCKLTNKCHSRRHLVVCKRASRIAYLTKWIPKVEQESSYHRTICPRPKPKTLVRLLSRTLDYSKKLQPLKTLRLLFKFLS